MELYYSIAGVTTIASVAIFGYSWLKVSQLKYGLVDRQDKFDDRLEQLEKDIEPLSPEQLAGMKNDINALKIKGGFQ